MDNIVSLYLLALSMCIYMENLELLAAKMSELLHVLCFAGIWTLLGLASMQNLKSVAQKMAELLQFQKSHKCHAP